jgi:hypothetical protein
LKGNVAKEILIHAKEALLPNNRKPSNFTEMIVDDHSVISKTNQSGYSWGGDVRRRFVKSLNLYGKVILTMLYFQKFTQIIS